MIIIIIIVRCHKISERYSYTGSLLSVRDTAIRRLQEYGPKIYVLRDAEKHGRLREFTRMNVVS